MRKTGSRKKDHWRVRKLVMIVAIFKYKFPAVNPKSDTIYEIQKSDTLEVRRGRYHQFRSFQTQHQ